MQLEIRIGYDRFLCEISGTQLDVLTSIMGKMTPVETRHVGSDEYFVTKDDGKAVFEARILSQVRLLTEAKYDEMSAAAQKADRAKMVAGIIAGTDTGDSLKDHLWYQSVFTREQRDAARVDFADEGYVVLRCGSDQYLTVKGDGSYEWGQQG